MILFRSSSSSSSSLWDSCSSYTVHALSNLSLRDSSSLWVNVDTVPRQLCANIGT